MRDTLTVAPADVQLGARRQATAVIAQVPCDMQSLLSSLDRLKSMRRSWAVSLWAANIAVQLTTRSALKTGIPALQCCRKVQQHNRSEVQ